MRLRRRSLTWWFWLRVQFFVRNYVTKYPTSFELLVSISICVQVRSTINTRFQHFVIIDLEQIHHFQGIIGTFSRVFPWILLQEDVFLWIPLAFLDRGAALIIRLSLVNCWLQWSFNLVVAKYVYKIGWRNKSEEVICCSI